MEKPVKQHYVPRFYLRSFSTTSKQNAVYAYRLSEKKLFGPVLVDHVAHENYFYDSDDATSLEGDLATLESKVASIHRKILTTQNLAILSPVEVATYADFVSFQYRRTRRSRDDIKMALNLMADAADLPSQSTASKENIRTVGTAVLSVADQILPSAIDKALTEIGIVGKDAREAKRSEVLSIAKKVLAKYREPLEKGQLPRDVQQGMREAAADPTRVKRLHIDAIPVMAARVAKSLVAMHWYLWPTGAAELLVTSDNPVIVFDGSLQTGKGSVESLPTVLGYSAWNDASGKLKPSLRILMPLSPRLMLLIAPTANLQLRTLDDKGTAALNTLVAAQSRDFLYSASNDFGSALAGVELKSTSLAALDVVMRLVLRKTRGTSET